MDKVVELDELLCIEEAARFEGRLLPCDVVESASSNARQNARLFDAHVAWTMCPSASSTRHQRSTPKQRDDVSMQSMPLRGCSSEAGA
jgi:hypothetical protein